MHRCWTCNNEHDLDEPCSASMTVRSMRSAGRPGNELADHTSRLFEEETEFGPVFRAGFESECNGCDEGIVPGEDVRADGSGGWIHADTMCERCARA